MPHGPPTNVGGRIRPTESAGECSLALPARKCSPSLPPRMLVTRGTLTLQVGAGEGPRQRVAHGRRPALTRERVQVARR